MRDSQSYEEVMARVRGLSKRGGTDTTAVSGIKDPAEQGEVTTPTDPKGEPGADTHIPSTTPATDANGNTGLPAGKNLDPKTVLDGKQTPVRDGAADDDVKSPTEKVAGTLAKIQQLRKNAGAVQETKTDEPSADKNASAKTGAPAKGKEPAAAKTDPDGVKSGSDEDVVALSHDVLFKLGCAIYEVEDGAKEATALLTKAAGAEKARELISAGQEAYLNLIAAENEELEKVAFEQQLDEEIAAYVGELTKDASEEDLAYIDQLSELHRAELDALETAEEKVAYAQGAQDDMMLEQAMAEGGEDADVPAGPVSLEDVLAMLEEAVQSGQMTEEEAMAIAEELMAEEAQMAEGGEMAEPKAASVDTSALDKLTENL